MIATSKCCCPGPASRPDHPATMPCIGSSLPKGPVLALYHIMALLVDRLALLVVLLGALKSKIGGSKNKRGEYSRRINGYK